ncbi:MAG: apolipoprotein N-acyltransferase [Candidatus Marinimicrobia bacterium]|nr:apolipoprotein N-acyltransferase [Candidatus Neomarinimicrobiota bacterium]|tara:strand:- start:8652 stop:10142 length:1491 start_codon:yes stop_codon:yes gene_type:complete
MIKVNSYLLVCFSAILTGVAQHSLGLGFLAWISLIPLLHVIVKQSNYKNIFQYSLLWGVVYHLVVVFWLSSNIGTTSIIAFISMLAAVLILCFNTIAIFSLWFFIKNKIKFNLIVLSIIWVSVEYLRSYGLLGFPWVALANTQTDYLYLIQNAEFVGIYGISFWVLLVNIFFFNVINHNFKNRKLYITFFLIILPWFSGYILFNKYNIESPDEGLSTLLVQPNVNLYDKRDFSSKEQTLDKIIKMTHDNLSIDTKLILWPESAMPFHRMQSTRDRNYLIDRLFKQDGSYLLSGNIFYEGSNIYNSSVLVSNNGIESVYHKRQLVPIAEHVPFSENFDYLKNINIGQTNFSKGKKDHVFNIDQYRFAALICFESTFPEINRRHANQDIDAIIYLVNDGWYTTFPQPGQHSKQAVFRAIENRLPIIRCTNTGISMLINPNGSIQESIGLNKAGTMHVKINKNKYEKTFYTRFGNVFSIVLLVFLILLLIRLNFRNEKK